MVHLAAQLLAEVVCELLKGVEAVLEFLELVEDLAHFNAVGDRSEYLVLLVCRVDLLLDLRLLLLQFRSLRLGLAKLLHRVGPHVEFFESLRQKLHHDLEFVRDLPLQGNHQAVTEALELVFYDGLQDDGTDGEAIDLDGVWDLVHVLTLRLQSPEVDIPLLGVLHLLHHLLHALRHQTDDQPWREGFLQLLHALEELVRLLEDNGDALLVPVGHRLVNVHGPLQALEHQGQRDERLDLLIVVGLQLFQRWLHPQLLVCKNKVRLHLWQILVQALQTKAILNFHDFENLVVPMPFPRSRVGFGILAPARRHRHIHDLLDLGKLLLPLIALPEQTNVRKLHNFIGDLLVATPQAAVDGPQALGGVLDVAREDLELIELCPLHLLHAALLVGEQLLEGHTLLQRHQLL
mmetsp:Transcript_110733/g.352701  ORF Transcript_110733/g.352701 Transcript_110733/m.352701 type:complete len:406 (-) Transcript_110733:1964-3181(-)